MSITKYRQAMRAASMPDSVFTFPKPFDVPGKFSLTVEYNGQGVLFVLPVADLKSSEDCEAMLRLIMEACSIDPGTLSA